MLPWAAACNKQRKRMPNTLALPATAKQNGAGPAQQQVLIPFMRGATPHAEPFYDTTFTITAAQQNLGPVDISAYGYARAIWVQCDVATTGNGATVAAFEDSPWSMFAELAVNDVNGAPLFGPHSGYECYLHHKYGGFRGQADPKLMSPTSFVALTSGAGATVPSGKFGFRINLERSSRDGLGALGNMNAAQSYKIRGTINNLLGNWTTPPSGAVTTLRVRMTLEAYSQPNATDAAGRPQMTAPPGNQTTGYSSRFQPVTVAGANTIKHTRVGNLIRNLIYVNRRAGTSRANGEADLASLQIQWYVDSRLLTNKSIELIRENMSAANELSNAAAEAAGGIDNGVFCLSDFIVDLDGHSGYEMRDGWLQTTQATRFEIAMTLANAGVLTVMTDDVAPRGNVYIT